MSGAPEGFATGWFVIATCEELAASAVLSLRYFGRKLVAFRGESGEAHVLDAHCPHLGADLGVGGTVVGDTIRCPFHAWRFSGAGQCVEIPYAKTDKIPPRACIKPWPVRERNGLVFVWHDRFGRPPTYEIPQIAEHGSSEWTPWKVSVMTIRTQPREIIENVADKAHFPRVHSTEIEEFENEFAGHIAIQRTSGVAYPPAGGVDRFRLVATYYGPAYQVTEMDSALPNRLINAHTPIDAHSLHLRFGVMLKKVAADDKMARYSDGYLRNLQSGFGEDVQIWENKAWRDRPMLCDGDGAIGALRRWYRQFYPDAPDEAQAQEAV